MHLQYLNFQTMIPRLPAHKISVALFICVVAASLSACLKDNVDVKEVPGLTESDTQSANYKEYYISVFSTKKEDSDRISNYLTQKQLRVVASQENGGTRIFAYPPPDKNNLAFIMDEFQQTQKLAMASKTPDSTKVQVFSKHNSVIP